MLFIHQKGRRPAKPRPRPFPKPPAMKKALFIILLCNVFSAISLNAQSAAAALQAAAEAAYDRGYTESEAADQAKAFDEAAGLFEKTARAYRAEGQEEMARGAEHMAGLARQNAEHRRRLAENTFFSPMGSLSGAAFKLYHTRHPHLFLLPEAGMPFPARKEAIGFDDGSIDQVQQALYSDPAFLERMFEQLGGEFFIGALSAPAKLEGFEEEYGLYKGATIGVFAMPHLRFEASYGQYRSRITAHFPVTAFRPETYEPYSLKGQLSMAAQHTEAALGASYAFGRGALQPFAGLGMHYSATRPGATQAAIAGLSFEVASHRPFHSFGPYFSGGLTWQPAGPVLLRLSGKAYTAKGQEGGKNALNGMLSLGLGLVL